VESLLARERCCVKERRPRSPDRGEVVLLVSRIIGIDGHQRSRKTEFWAKISGYDAFTGRVVIKVLIDEKREVGQAYQFAKGYRPMQHKTNTIAMSPSYF